MLLWEKTKQLYNTYGQGKPMGGKAPNTGIPHFFLHRTFMREQDLLIIFNTRRCRYRCYFCDLPTKCSSVQIPDKDILAQFEYVITEMKHSLGVLNRVTFSNEGSVLDIQSFPTDTLLVLSRCVQELRRVRTFVLETRLEFVKPETINQIDMVAPRARINILTGFETLNSCIRNKILGKQQTLEQFEEGLDKVAEASADLTAFVLFKPSQMMTDSEAYMEASASIDYLVEQCEERNVDLTIRLNPMYAAKGTIWAEIACHTSEYKPPRLTDVIDLAYQKSQEGVSVYIGLSTEGLNESWGSYQSREDFSRNLLKKAILFNNGVIS